MNQANLSVTSRIAWAAPAVMGTRIVRNAMLLLVLLITTVPALADSTFGGGNGTQESPYIISTTDHLTQLANDVNGGNEYYGKFFRLDADLDFSGKTYIPIGRYVSSGSSTGYWAFTGVFDGNGHTIRNVTVNQSGTYGVGLFGMAAVFGVIKNLTLASSSITGKFNVGGIVGQLMGYTSSTDRGIRNCTVEADVTISGNNTVGGVVGWTEGDVCGCINFGTVAAKDKSYVGGIAGGTLETGYINLCYVGGNCTLGAIGEENSATGTDEGVDAAHLCTISFADGFSTAYVSSDADFTHGSTKYYKSGKVVYVCVSVDVDAPAGYYGRTFRAGDTDLEHYPYAINDNFYTFTVPYASDVQVTFDGVKRDIAYSDWVHVTIPAQTYTGKSLTPVVTVTDSEDGSATTLIKGTHYQLVVPEEPMVNAGDYPVKVKGIGNFGNSVTATFTIGKLPSTAAVATPPTAIEGLVYTASPQALVTAGTAAAGCVMVYSLDGENYSTDIPTATRPGNYTVYYAAHSDDNHFDSEPQTLEAVITALDFAWVGEGTSDNPYRITTVEEMTAIATNLTTFDYKNVYFSLEADLDYTGKTYTVVGDYNNQFKGTFNGNFHTINNVAISSDDAFYQGLFGVIDSDGVVENLIIGSGCTIRGRSNVGAIAGRNYGSITDCNSYASVSGITYTYIGRDNEENVAGGEYVGSITGNNYGTVEGCSNYGSITGYRSVGGIVGIHFGNGVTGCLNHGSVSGSSYVGGIIGYCGANNVADCINEGTVTSVSHVGGIIGYWYEGTVSRCLNIGEVTCSNYGYGGIVGTSNGTPNISHSYYAGACTLNGGVYGSDIAGKAMRGYTVSAADNISINLIPYDDDYAGITYDGINYLGAGETGYYQIDLTYGVSAGGITVSNGTLTKVDDDYYNSYYKLEMPTQGQNVTISMEGTPVLTLLDDDRDDYNRFRINDGYTGNVKIEGRKLWKDGKWNTLCLPFSLTATQVAELLDAPSGLMTLNRTVFEKTTGTLTLTFSNELPYGIMAGKPYLIKWDEANEHIDDPTFSNVTVSSTNASAVKTTYADFVGTYATIFHSEENNSVLYLGDNNTLYYPQPTTEKPTVTIGAFRAFFALKGITVGEPSAELAVRSFIMRFADDPATEGSITGDDVMEISSIANDQSPTSTSGWFTIDGRKLNGKPATKGLYICNGRKVAVK